MISQHFSQSQFILISLKDGMFNNANVLFKTSFVDGLSKVDRVVLKNRDKKKGGQGEFEEKENFLGKEKRNNRMILEGN
jgi:structural maintenance of chromosome 2